MKTITKFILILSSVLLLVACGENRQQVVLDGQTMGTYYSIKYIEQDGLPSTKEIRKAIDEKLELVNDQMSTYRPESELSRFNAWNKTTPFEVSEDTAKVVKEAQRIAQLSNGSYDITVGPLVNLWSFGPEARPDSVPTEDKLEQRKSEIGYQHLLVLGTNKLQKNKPDIYVDLSSIAKGYGVDVIATYLQSLDIADFMVDIGGEVRLQGHNQKDIPWRIAVEKPLSNERTVQEILDSKGNAIATSGDYRNYFEEDGVRYSHIINPKTGKPINNRVVSVTVIDPSCMTADAFATAFSVLGEVDGMKLATRLNLPVLFIVKTDDGFKEVASNNFKQYVVKQ